VGKILIACEESQAVCKAFRERGHEAYSCDIQECSGGHPEWHIQDDAIKILYSNKWDLVIAHPPCTYLSFAGNAWFNIDKYGEKAKERIKLRKEAEEFFMKFYNYSGKIAIENPRGSINQKIKPTQIIHPYFFGDEEKKTTCLWLKNLPKLIHIKDNDLFNFKTHSQEPKPNYIDRSGKKRYFTDSFAKTQDRVKLRSKTFPSIANAMADQWGKFIHK